MTFRLDLFFATGTHGGNRYPASYPQLYFIEVEQRPAISTTPTNNIVLQSFTHRIWYHAPGNGASQHRSGHFHSLAPVGRVFIGVAFTICG